MRILAVDPGKKHLGIALSDPSGSVAAPLTVLDHISRLIDAAAIAALAAQHEAKLIIVGQSLDMDNKPTPQGRHAARLAAAVQTQTGVPVELWDEWGSTQAARFSHISMGGSAKQRRQRGHGHLDDLAAMAILQSYLDSRTQ